ncbi:AAA family ATPase [Burkholderia sp. ISTR5]|nr:AAA family ATPase [Burkholderia sp. ISTR5]
MSAADLGPRICVMGPSNSGKSTLASAIGHAFALPVIHLDQLFHQPGTDWQPRPQGEFIALHEQAIAGDQWVMDGNYSVCLSRRLQRATGFILVDTPTAISLFRYLRRSWIEQNRHGGLAGSRNTVQWEMIRHIVVATRANRVRYARIFNDIGLPKIRMTSAHAVRAFCRESGVVFPPG